MGNTPKMKDVAEAAGVSPMTVSRAFRKDASVSDDTRARILEIAQSLGYVFDATASTLRSKRTGFVAVTIPSLNNANFADTVTAMSEVLAEHGLQVLLGYTNYNMRDEEQLVENLLRRRPEALVLTGGNHTQRTRDLLKQAEIPVVEIWDVPVNPIEHVVGFSNAQAMKLVVEHLLNKGLTQLGFLGGAASGDTRGSDRKAGFVSAMQAKGLEPHVLSPSHGTPMSMQEGGDATIQMLSAYPQLQGFVCVSDLVAFGSLCACQRQGLKVPQDRAVAGFGNFEISATSHPRLTTVDVSSRIIGEKTGALLARLLVRLGRPVNSDPVCEVVQTELIVRQSTP
ncbi:MAG: LacI family DNA-binding transcriptional regulator [Pseudomonadota bacterium]